ncbi:hypothetical protein [Janthinobacterium tructae]|uniref:Uncharacterized protein n=1 Tax=Janthinobacterium tructae TaxID=2590869 RepID=A0A4Y6RKP7_9BURK|nr:hypothetical protein [Janthinobacterium tructae]QDG73523.1 hypothetical protein FJQ89_26175 [Janthinobacterium tructae]
MDDIKYTVNSANEFYERLIGKDCWSIIAGPGTGSMVSFYFGGKIRRERPLKNSTLSLEQRQFDGEFVIFVKHSEWNVLHENEIICTSNDNNEKNGKMLYGLNILVGKSIVFARITNEYGGLNLEFSEGWFLNLIGIENNTDLDSYSLFHSGKLISNIVKKSENH